MKSFHRNLTKLPRRETRGGINTRKNTRKRRKRKSIIDPRVKNLTLRVILIT